MSRQSEGSSSSIARPGIEQPEYAPEERRLLLQIARESIVSFLEQREISMLTPSEHLSEPRGVFTTLYSRGRLRGCVGYPAAILPLYRAVVETARSAASDDPRFSPIHIDEIQDLKISLSVLSALRPAAAEEVEIGRDGLVISQHGLRGLLLPQVPVERGWDRITFLEQTCLKAGLPTTAWQTGAQIEAFTAEAFGDNEGADCSR
jgi:AmmeMemoRadiSam system protein A